MAAVGGEETACRRAMAAGGLSYNKSGLALTWSSVVACATVTLYFLSTKHTTRLVLPFSGACSSFHTATASKVLDGVLIGTACITQCHFRVSITSVSYGVYKSVCSMSAW